MALWDLARSPRILTWAWKSGDRSLAVAISESSSEGNSMAQQDTLRTFRLLASNRLHMSMHSSPFEQICMIWRELWGGSGGRMTCKNAAWVCAIMKLKEAFIEYIVKYLNSWSVLDCVSNYLDARWLSHTSWYSERLTTLEADANQQSDYDGQSIRIDIQYTVLPAYIAAVQYPFQQLTICTTRLHVFSWPVI